MRISPDTCNTWLLRLPSGTLAVSAIVPTLAMALSNAVPPVKALCSILPMPAAATTFVRLPTSAEPRLLPLILPADTASPPMTSASLPLMPSADGMICT